jgi:SMC interacting uncharacterized protein involved in chromosome segregation
MATVKQVEAELTVVKHDVNQIGKLFVKLEATLDKLGTVCNNATQILAVHEQRLSEGERTFNNIQQDMAELEEKMSKDIDKVLEAIKDLKVHIGTKHDKLEDRIENLEKWRWIIMGALVAGGMFLPEIRNLLMSNI